MKVKAGSMPSPGRANGTPPIFTIYREDESYSNQESFTI